MEKKDVTVKEITKLGGNYKFIIKNEIVSKKSTKLDLSFPNKKSKGYTSSRAITPYDCHSDAGGSYVLFSIGLVQSIIAQEKLSPSTKVNIEFQYVPKTNPN